MSEKIDPLKYAENIRTALMDGDNLAVEKLEEKYGDQEVKLKDVEHMFSETMRVLSNAYMEKDRVDTAKMYALKDTLVAKGLIEQITIDRMEETLNEKIRIIEGDYK